MQTMRLRTDKTSTDKTNQGEPEMMLRFTLILYQPVSLHINDILRFPLVLYDPVL